MKDVREPIRMAMVSADEDAEMRQRLERHLMPLQEQGLLKEGLLILAPGEDGDI